MILGMVAHVDAGKTTLSEALLYTSGKIRSLGRVDHQNAYLDSDTQEKERGITIFSKQAQLDLKDTHITLLDTPGHVDFSAETERALTVLDSAVLVVSATDGVQGHTRTLWKLLKHYGVPTFLFINKMDLDGADRDRTAKSLKSELSDGCIDFGEYGTEEFFENIALCSDELLAQYTDNGAIDDKSIANAVAKREVFPCFYGSALRLGGIEELLNGLVKFLPERTYPEEFSATVFKIGRDQRGERLTYLKITGGSLAVKEKLSYSIHHSVRGLNKSDLNSDEITEKIDQIRVYSGNRFETKDIAEAGEICAVTGLSSTFPGQGLGNNLSESIPLLEPVLEYRVFLPQEVNAVDMMKKLKQLEEEDPQLRIVWNEALQEIHAHIMGQVQIEVLTRLIKDRFGVDVTFGTGNIIYRETIAKAVEGLGHFEPLRHYAEVHLLLEPGEPGSGICVDTACSEDILSLNWQRLIATHIEEREHIGVLTGSALTDVKITILTGKAHIKHTEGGDFRQATYRAIRQGLKSTQSVLLEPYYSFVLEVPTENVGRAMTDLRAKFGKFDAPEYVSGDRGDIAILKGTAPVVTMQDYVQTVYSYTKGLGVLTLELSGYDVCHNSEEVIAEKAYDSEADVSNPTGSVFCTHGAGFTVPWNEVENYIHIPKVYSDDFSAKSPTDGYRFNSEGYSADETKRLAVKSSDNSTFKMSGYELDAELAEIYDRLFGENRYSDDKYARRKWGKKSEKSKPPRVKLDKKGNPIYPENKQKKRILVVDGYNIIFAWDYLNELSRVDIGSARDRLNDILLNYQGFEKTSVLVVYDAYRVKENSGTKEWYDGKSRSQKKAERSADNRGFGIEVVYTKTDETADTYIEHFVRDKMDKYSIRVATNDSLEQLMVMAHGALRMSANELLEEIKRSHESLKAEVESLKRKDIRLT